MQNTFVAEQQMPAEDFTPRAGAMLRSSGGSGGISQVGSTAKPGLMQLTEAELTALENLRSLMAKLEEVLDPICVARPESTDGLAKEAREPDMSRPDSRLMVIIDQTMKLSNRMERLLNRVNL